VLNTLPDWYHPGTAITLREIYWVDPTLNDIPGPDDEMQKPPSAGELILTIRLASVDSGTYTGSTETQSTLATAVPPCSSPWRYTLGTENSIGLIFIDLNAVDPGPNGQPVVAVERGEWKIASGETFNAVVLVSAAPEGYQPIANFRWVVDEDSGLVLHAEEYGYGGGATMQTTDPITGTAPGPTTIFIFDVTSVTRGGI